MDAVLYHEPYLECCWGIFFNLLVQSSFINVASPHPVCGIQCSYSPLWVKGHKIPACMLNKAWIVPSLLKRLPCMSPIVNKAWEEYVDILDFQNAWLLISAISWSLVADKGYWAVKCSHNCANNCFWFNMSSLDTCTPKHVIIFIIPLEVLLMLADYTWTVLTIYEQNIICLMHADFRWWEEAVVYSPLLETST